MILEYRAELTVWHSFAAVPIKGGDQDSRCPVRRLVPLQLVPGIPFENTFSVFASDTWTVIWPT